MTPEEGGMTRMDDLDRKDDAERAWEREPEPEEIERARENVLDGWPSAKLDDPPEDPVGPVVALGVEAEPAEADVEPLSEAESSRRPPRSTNRAASRRQRSRRAPSTRQACFRFRRATRCSRVRLGAVGAR
jgi:hypothetical protein